MSELESSLSQEAERYFATRGEEAPAPEPVEEAPQTQEPPPELGNEAEPAQAPAEEDEGQGSKKVPHGAFAEERARRKAAEERERALEQRLAVLNDRTEQILRSMYGQGQPGQPQRPAAPQAPPNPDEDPIEAVKYTQQQLAEIAKRQQMAEAHQVQAARVGQLVSWYDQDTTATRSEVPDYSDAHSYLYRSIFNETKLTLQAVNPNISDADIDRLVKQQELQLVATCAAQRRSPSKYIYDLAKARGYQAQPAKPAPEQAVEQLERREAAQADNRSLSSAGGSAPRERMTADRLVGLPPEEFAKWLKANGAKGFKRLAGG